MLRKREHTSVCVQVFVAAVCVEHSNVHSGQSPVLRVGRPCGTELGVGHRGGPDLRVVDLCRHKLRVDHLCEPEIRVGDLCHHLWGLDLRVGCLWDLS